MITKIEIDTLRHAEENRKSLVDRLAKALEYLGAQPTAILERDLGEWAISVRDLEEAEDLLQELFSAAFQAAAEERNLRLPLRRRQEELHEALAAKI